MVINNLFFYKARGAEGWSDKDCYIQFPHTQNPLKRKTSAFTYYVYLNFSCCERKNEPVKYNTLNQMNSSFSCDRIFIRM